MRTGLALLAAVVLAHAGDKTVDVTCPIDGTKFKATQVSPRPAFGGIDRDFCQHAACKCPLELQVWVCPTCYFAGTEKDYADKSKPDLKGKLKPCEDFKGAMPGHVKFDLLAQVRKLKGNGRDAIGTAYLWAAWTARHRGELEDRVEDFEEFAALRRAYGFEKKPLDLGKENRTDYELRIIQKVEQDLAANKYKEPQLSLAKYLCALTYRRHGELEAAGKWIDDLIKNKGSNSIIDEEIEKMARTIEIEKPFLRKALEEFKAHLEQEKDKAKVCQYAYMAGELHRRLGEKKEAEAMYTRAIDACDEKDPKKQPQHVKWAHEQLKLVK